MSEGNELMAACGLHCRECDMLRAANDPEAPSKIADSFRREGFPDVRPKDIRCFSCEGDRAAH